MYHGGTGRTRHVARGIAMIFQRHPDNPIVIPGRWDWRRVSVFNPACVIGDDGRFYLFERATESLDPLRCHVGLLVSDDGVRFEHVQDTPVLSPEDFPPPCGTVEDPRVVRLDGRYVLTYARRKFASSCHPNGVGVPRYTEHPDAPDERANVYRAGIAVSDDMRAWTDLGLVTEDNTHDRDLVLFPQRVGGRYAMLRRPESWVGAGYGTDRPSIWLTYGDSLTAWDPPVLVCKPQRPWESRKVGAATPPLRTDAGWLVLYHGVDDRDSTYRVGAMLLDADDPARVLARTPEPLMEPQAYYEKVGLIIPNVIFPTGNVIVGDTIHLYYGCCDTCIALATARVADVLAAMR